MLCARPPILALAGVLFVASCAPADGPAGVEGSASTAGKAVGAAAGTVPEPDAARLVVVVTAAEDGFALADLPVTAARGAVVLEERTGADGAARFELAPGDYDVALDPPEGEPAHLRLAAGEAREHALRVSTLAADEITLRIVGDEDERPLAGASVRVAGVPARTRGALVEAETGADGTARLRVPAWSPTVASITAPGRGEVRIALPLEPEAAGRVRLARLALTGELHGRLINPAGVPVAGVELVARVATAELFLVDAAPRAPAAAGRAIETVAAATTAEDGGFVLVLPAFAGVMLAAEADEVNGRPQRTLGVVRLEPGESAERELVLRTGTRVDGTLLGPDDAPYAGVPMWLVRGGGRRVFTRFEEVEDRAVTDAEGRFAFLGVEPGSWRIGPAPPRGEGETPLALSAVPALLEVVPGMPRAEVVVRPPESLYVSGRTVDATGAPVGGIGLIAIGGGQSAHGESDPDGTFQVGPLAPGELDLRTTAGPGLAPSAPRSIRAGDTDVEIEIVRTGALRGAVTRGGGAAPASAEVRLERNAGARAAGARSLATDGGGEFLVADAEPGSYVVVARAEPDLVAARAVEVVSEATAEIALDLSPGARARCRLDDRHAALVFVVFADGLPVERGRVDARTELVTRDFPAGEFAIELHGPAGLIDRRTSTVLPGRTIDLSFVR